MRTHKPAQLTTLIAALVLITVAAPAWSTYARPAQKPGDPVVEVTSAVQQDISPPLRDMTGFAATTPDEGKEKPLCVLPGHGVGANPNDTAVQSNVGPLVGTTNGLNFAGVGQGDYGFSDQYAPPDTNGAVGATQYVQWVNVNLVYERIPQGQRYVQLEHTNRVVQVPRLPVA